MSNELQGKVAFITGGARGQGRAHAVRLASMGADIVAVDLAGPVGEYLPYPPATPDDLAETVRLVDELDRRFLAVEADVRDKDALKAAADRAVAELGSLDIVVANAGICEPARWQDITDESWRATIDINLTGVWNTITATAPHMIDAGHGGAIVVTSSYAGKKVQPMMIHCTAPNPGELGAPRGSGHAHGRRRDDGPDRVLHRGEPQGQPDGSGLHGARVDGTGGHRGRRGLPGVPGLGQHHVRAPQRGSGDAVLLSGAIGPVSRSSPAPARAPVPSGP